MSRVAIRVLDLTDVYTITINGNAVAFDAGGAGSTTALEVLEGWRDAINADVTVGPLVTAVVEDADGDGTNDTLVVRGDAEADYSVAVSVAGAAELDLLADPSTLQLRIYLQERTPKAPGIAVPNVAATGFVGKIAPGDWRQPNGAEYNASFRGFTEEFNTAGQSRIYVELFNITNPGGDAALAPHTFTLTPRITTGPAALESSGG